MADALSRRGSNIVGMLRRMSLPKLVANLLMNRINWHTNSELLRILTVDGAESIWSLSGRVVGNVHKGWLTITGRTADAREFKMRWLSLARAHIPTKI